MSRSSFLLVLFGCSERGTDSSGNGTTTGDGGADAYGCVETDRNAVTDPSLTPDGFSFAPATVLAVAVGDFVGTATLRDGADVEGAPLATTFTVIEPTALWAITRAFDDGGGDSGPGIGAEPDPSACAPYYEAEVVVGLLTEDGALAESVAAPLSIFAMDGASTGFSLDVGALIGTMSPSFDPDDYDSTTLSMAAATASGGWAGELQWSATRDLGNGTGEGIVGPAGSFAVAAVR